MRRARFHTATSALAVAVAFLAPMDARSQTATQAPTDSQAHVLSQELIHTLQSIRPLGAPPPVSQVIQATGVDGRIRTMPVSASLALWDLTGYEGHGGYAGQLESLFPVSRDDYPFDSIAEIQRARAAEWVRRLLALSATEQRYAVSGSQQVQFAKVALLAGNDSLARRLFDARVAELASNPVEQSEVLRESVLAFADPAQDTVRLIRNLAIAERYLTALHAVRTSGYKTQHDSASVLYHIWKTEDELIPSYAAVGDTARVLAHARALLSYAVILGPNERQAILAHSYYRVYRALSQTPAGRAQMKAWQAPVLAMARRAETELPANATVEDRKAVQGLVEGSRQWIGEVDAWLALLDTPAASLSAHLWINTPDSLYDSTPRVRSLADGKIHVFAFGSPYEPYNFPVLNRVQRRFPSGVEALLVTTTFGTTGPDIAGPREESVWLARYLREGRHFTMPIALWAGSKRQTGFVPEGHYPKFEPERTPNERPYNMRMLAPQCVVTDTHGIIRFFQPIETRDDEIRLWARVQRLLDDSKAERRAPSSVTSSPANTHVTQ